MSPRLFANLTHLDIRMSIGALLNYGAVTGSMPRRAIGHYLMAYRHESLKKTTLT